MPRVWASAGDFEEALRALLGYPYGTTHPGSRLLAAEQVVSAMDELTDEQDAAARRRRRGRTPSAERPLSPPPLATPWRHRFSAFPLASAKALAVLEGQQGEDVRVLREDWQRRAEEVGDLLDWGSVVQALARVVVGVDHARGHVAVAAEVERRAGGMRSAMHLAIQRGGGAGYQYIGDLLDEVRDYGRACVDLLVPRSYKESVCRWVGRFLASDGDQRRAPGWSEVMHRAAGAVCWFPASQGRSDGLPGGLSTDAYREVWRLLHAWAPDVWTGDRPDPDDLQNLRGRHKGYCERTCPVLRFDVRPVGPAPPGASLTVRWWVVGREGVRVVARPGGAPQRSRTIGGGCVGMASYRFPTGEDIRSVDFLLRAPGSGGDRRPAPLDHLTVFAE